MSQLARLSTSLLDGDRSIKAIMKGTGIAVFGLLAGRAMEYFTRLILAQSLGVDQFGVLLLAINLLQFGSALILLGIPIGIARYIPYARGIQQGAKEPIIEILMTGIRLCLPLAGFVALIFWVGRDVIANQIFQSPDLATPLQFIALAMPFVVLTELFLALLRGSKAIAKYVLGRDIIGLGMRLLLILAFVLGNLNLLSASVAYLLAFASSTLAVIIFSKEFLPRSVQAIFRASFFKELLHFSWPLVISSLVKQTSGPVMGTLILGYFSDETAVGLYGAAFTVANLIGMSLVGVRIIFMPVFTELYAAQKFGEMKSMFGSTSRWIFYAALPATILVFLYNRQILSLFGEEYVNARSALLILGLSYLLSCLVGPTGQVLLAAGHSKLHLLLDILYAFVNLSLSLLLIPRWGIIGAALATSSAMFIWNVFSVLLVFHHLRIQPITSAHGTFLLSMLTTSGVLMIASKMLVRDANIASLLIGAIIIGLAVLSFIGFLSPLQDRSLVHVALRRIFQKTEWRRA